MRIYIDTADASIIKELCNWGSFAGVTTNPIILSQSKLSPQDAANKISQVQDGDIFIQAKGNTVEEMEENARWLATLVPSRVMVKIPMNEIGLKVMRNLRDERIWTAATALFSIPQALLAMGAGADILIPFYGRLKTSGFNPVEIIQHIQLLCDKKGGKPRILVASVKSVDDIIEISKLGVWGITIPPAVAKQMIHHELTVNALEAFNKADKYNEE